MFGPYVHNIDPIIAKVGGVYLLTYPHNRVHSLC